MKDNRLILWKKRRIQIQGVGFSPYVYAATEFVLNAEWGVSNKIDCSSLNMKSLIVALKERVLSLARVDSLTSGSLILTNALNPNIALEHA